MLTATPSISGDVAELLGGVGHVVPAVLAEFERDDRCSAAPSSVANGPMDVARSRRHVADSATSALDRRRSRPGSARRRAGRRRRRDVVGSWNVSSLSSALADSALAGSHEEASLFCTSVSFEANIPATPKTATQAMSTIHLVMGEVSFPAIWRCMGTTPSEGGDSRHRGFPELARSTRQLCRTHRHRCFSKSDRSRTGLDHCPQSRLPMAACRGRHDRRAAGLRGRASRR